MSKNLFKQVQALVSSNDYEISVHAFQKLDRENLLFADVLIGLQVGEIVEEYPDYHKGPCILICSRDGAGHPFHALWGLAKGTEIPAVLITVYRPDPDLWSDDFVRRKQK